MIEERNGKFYRKNKQVYPTKCSGCGELIYRTAYELKRSKNFFCTDKNCKDIWLSHNLLGELNPNYSKVEVECSNPNCEMLFWLKDQKLKDIKIYFVI